MKTKFNGILTLLLALTVQFVFAQKTVSGTVSDDSGPLPGVSVVIKGTKAGTETDFDGKYSIEVKKGEVLQFSYIGMPEVLKTVGDENVIDVTMSGGEQLEEVIISGVAGATSKKKLSVSVENVTAKALEKVPAGSAASALMGKVAGVSVTNLGRPGDGATILLRGAANLYGSQEPLVLMDGIIVEGGLADINVDDIESFEIVKGASASSLYGSRAGNGVIVIRSKRGKLDKTEITVRSELGYSEINRFIETNQSHHYTLASDWENFIGQYTKFQGLTYPSDWNRVYSNPANGYFPGLPTVTDADRYSDNPWAVKENLQELFFQKGVNNTIYASINSGSEKSRYFFSTEKSNYEGVIKEAEGYNRFGIRLNADFNLNEWLTFKASNNFISLIDNSPLASIQTYRTISRLSPEANVTEVNPDGQPYYYTPDPMDGEITNPLYEVYARDAKSKQQRFLGGYNLNVKFTDYLNADLEYAFENNSYRYLRNNKYESYEKSGDEEYGFSYSKGGLYQSNFLDLSQKAQATLNFSKKINEWDVNAKASYLFEDRSYNDNTTNANNYLYSGIISFDNFNIADISATSSSSDDRAQNFFGILGLVYKDRYILDGLYRKDGSSLFGANERWQNYYRLSGAYRISQDFELPGVQELKIHGAVGTSGQRPGYDWQYEVIQLVNGSFVTDRIKGNPDLRPSLTKETELGLNTSFLNRFDLDYAYSHQLVSDQFMLVNLFAPANAGFNKQWQNVGDLESKTHEITLNSKIIKKENLKWNLGINFTKSESMIKKLDVAEQLVGPAEDSNDAGLIFLIKEGVEFGSMFGYNFVEDLETMSNQLPTGTTIDQYSVNSDGFVVLTSAIGTPLEKPFVEMRDGAPKYDVIGNQNADFRVGFTSNFTFKNFDFYMLWDWKQGGDVYNKNNQWNTINFRSAIVDQAGKADDEKKTVDYYAVLYDTNRENKFWVEDGTFVKLREVSLSYNLGSKLLDQFASGFFKEIKVSAIGRNLLTMTKYSGWDPEVAAWDSATQQYFSVDYGVYPNQSSYSMSLQLKF